MNPLNFLICPPAHPPFSSTGAKLLPKLPPHPHTQNDAKIPASNFKILLQAEDEGLMKHWVQAIDQAAMAIIVDERKDANKLRKLTSFRNRYFVHRL